MHESLPNHHYGTQLWQTGGVKEEENGVACTAQLLPCATDDRDDWLTVPEEGRCGSVSPALHSAISLPFPAASSDIAS